MQEFLGYHSEWNLGSPGGWDYQRTTQELGKAVWRRLNRVRPLGVDLDFDHPLLYPVYGFVEMLVAAHRRREGSNPGLIAVVAEEETLCDVTENVNLAKRLNAVPGISSALLAPHELELMNGRVCYRGRPVSLIFVDFNTDVLLALHKKHNLAPLLQAVQEGRVINPRGTEPINVKGIFETLSDPALSPLFSEEIVRRTPWTRRFFARRTQGPQGETIPDLIEWTRKNWRGLVLKPERGYSGKGVRVGEVNPDPEEAVALALAEGSYIVQERIPLNLWAEEIPELDEEKKRVVLSRVQTDFRCLLGPETVFGFLGRYGGVPTNVGCGGGVQPLGILKSEMSVREAVNRINQAILEINYAETAEVLAMQREMALADKFTYLLGPIKIALRPRVLTLGQLEGLKSYCAAMWKDCLTLEKMWQEGALDGIVNLDEEELAIVRMQPWRGSPAIIASDGLFSFGAHREESKK